MASVKKTLKKLKKTLDRILKPAPQQTWKPALQPVRVRRNF